MPSDKFVVKHEFAIDIVWVDRNPVLQVVDTYTNFQNAVPIRSKLAEDICLELVEVWASLYVAYTSVIRIYQESSFESDLFKSADAIRA